jgi:hypothetical protein
MVRGEKQMADMALAYRKRAAKGGSAWMRA